LLSEATLKNSRQQTKIDVKGTSMETMGSYKRARLSRWDVALGIWVLISPFVLGHRQSSAFLWNNIAVGIVLGLLAPARSSGADARGRTVWFNVLLGIWLIISPFVLGFFHLMAPMWNNVIVGIVVALVGVGSANARDKTVSE
jgi:hypothetical protein